MTERDRAIPPWPPVGATGALAEQELLSFATPGTDVDRGADDDRRAWPMKLRLEQIPGAPTVAADIRAGGTELVLLLHGLACGRQSFATAFEAPALRPFSLCAIDLPGHGNTAPGAPEGDQLEAYAALCAAVVDLLAPEQVHLVGHSMGTAIGLLAADHLGSRLGAFISIEGNLVGDDCSLVSRTIAGEHPEHFRTSGFGGFLTELDNDSETDVQAWGSWAKRCDAEAVHAAARSLVAWSDSGQLAARYRGLTDRVYVYGERNGLPRHLNGIVDEGHSRGIADSGHFPMVDNPRSTVDSGRASLRYRRGARPTERIEARAGRGELMFAAPAPVPGSLSHTWPQSVVC